MYKRERAFGLVPKPSTSRPTAVDEGQAGKEADDVEPGNSYEEGKDVLSKCEKIYS